MSNFKLTAESVEPAFSTPIYYSHVEGCEFDVSKMEGELEDEFYFNEFHTNTLNSAKPNLLLHDRYKGLRDITDAAMERYAYDMLKLPREAKLRLVDSWMVVGAPGSVTNQHIHINSMFSGVLYLLSEPGAGDFTLYVPECHPTYCTPTVKPEPTELNILNNPYWSMEPKTHDIIIFPSHCYHRVTENKSENIRVAVAFNYFMDGVISTNSTGRLTINCTEE